jgi:hypothetical protein
MSATTDEEWKANISLIAAAPDMKNALEELEENLIQFKPEKMRELGLHEAFMKLRASLAMAKSGA